MSGPTRYDLIVCRLVEEEGEYVLYSDRVAEVERLRREQVEFTGAALCALGVNRDESVAPGNQVLSEIERLRRELAEAEEAIREAGDLIDELIADRWSSVADDLLGERAEWKESRPVQRAFLDKEAGNV